MRLRLYHTLSKLTAVILLMAVANKGLAQTPSANFSATPLAGCSPLIVSFNDLSTGSPTSWTWNFGNGNTSTIQNPTATYFTPGSYTVTLTVANANGSNTISRTQYISVYEPPVVDFDANTRSGCFPLRVQFSDLSTAGAGNTNVKWEWDLGNGTTSTLQNPLIVYNNAGTFNVTLKVTNDKGCSKVISKSGYINATNGVRASFTKTNPVVCAAPADISFTNTSTGPPVLSYLWDFGDGSPLSTATNPVHTYNTNGTYTAILVTSSSAGCTDSVFSSPIVIGGNVTDFNLPASVCINEDAVLTNNSTPTPVSAFWRFGDGGTSTAINSTHSYSATGAYTIWLYNNYGNCTDSTSHIITVNPRPVANFSAPVTSKCEPPLTVNFQDISTGGATAWQWSFGDGGTSTLQNPSHTYNAYGSYDVTLITTNGFGCTDTIIQPAYIVIQRASIAVPGLPARGCIPFTITPNPVITSVDAITSYNWDFGDGGSSTLQNPTYTYITQGTYNVRLIITTSSGCTDTLDIPNAITVGSKPTVDFSAAPIPVCGHQQVYFTDLSTPVNEWHWDFGNGATSTLQNPVYRYTDTGYFSIRLIALNNGCPDTMTKTNYVRVLPPIARFTSTTNCSNRLQFTFTDQSIDPQSWEWDFGDGSPLVTTQNPVHYFPALGAYTVRLVTFNGSCSDTITHIIRAVGEVPDFGVNQTTACKETNLFFFLATNVNGANVANYAWDFGDGNTYSSAMPNAAHNYMNAGTYSVSLTITDINGCVDMVTKNNLIRINGPVANFTANNISGCAGLTTTFNDLTTTDAVNAITNWQWDFGDGTIQNFSSPPFVHTYTAAGTYSVKLIVTDAFGCMDSVLISNLVTTTDPIPNFISANTKTCPGANVIFTNTSTPSGLTYQWDFGDGGTSTTPSPTYVYTAAGLFDVKLVVTDVAGCSDSVIKTTFIQVDTPHADFMFSDSISSCLPLEVKFTNSSTFFNAVTWDFGPGEGTSTLSNPVHYYSQPGTFPVKLRIVSPGGCVDSIIKNIYVYDTVGSNITYLPLGGCKPVAANFSAFTPGQIKSYFWDFGDGYTTTTTTPTISHTYASYGNFIPKVIMEDPSGCKIPLQGANTVLVIGAEAKFGIDTSFFCDFGTVNFTDSTTFNDPVTTYNWSFGDGGTSSLQNPSHQYTAEGLYNVQLVVQTQTGCRDTLVKPQLIKVINRPLIDITGNTVICVNSPLQHNGIFLRADTSVVSWLWNFPNGNTSNQQVPPPQVYTTAGNFIVTSIATNSSGCKDTATQSILVNPLPTVNMPGQMTIQTGFPVVIPATYTPNTINWLWSPASGLSCTTCPTPEANPKFNTTYQVYFTDANGCSNIGSVEVIVICKNANLFVPNTFTPNGDGSNDIFYPRGKGLFRVKFMRIFNRWGEVVFEKNDFPVNDPSVGWNGTYKGKQPKADVYVYQVEVLCDNGETIRLNGNIALVL